MQSRILTALVAGALCSCAPSGTDPDTQGIIGRKDAVIVANGRELNGRELNGRELNGRELNGRELNGRELNGRELNGRELNGRELNGRELNGVSLNAVSLGTQVLPGVHVEGSVLVSGSNRGADFVGAILTQGDLRLRIDAVVPSPYDADIFFHQVSYSVSGGDWSSLCGFMADGTEHLAIPLAGAFDGRSGVPGGGAKIRDPSLVMFACRGYAIAKCMEWGFAPWRTASRCDAAGRCHPLDLDVMHEACTRMVRADYCGDGRSFTRVGTLINIYDAAGIQVDTETWEFEAEWNAQGTLCLENRRTTNSSTVPHCGRDLSQPNCGDPLHFDGDTLLMTERSPTTSSTHH